MAIKNSNLGGTDWIDGEVLYNTDLNDTFDASSLRNYTTVDFIRNYYSKTLKYIGNEDLTATTNIDTTNTTALYMWNLSNDTAPIGKVYPMNLTSFYDDFEDNSIDTGKWTTSGDVSEAAGQLKIDNGETSYAQTASTIFVNDRMDFNYETNTLAIPSNANLELDLTDGTNSVVLTGLQGAKTGQLNNYVILKKSLTNVLVSVNGAAFTTVDCSTVTGTWALKFIANNLGSGTYLELNLNFVADYNITDSVFYTNKLNTTTDTISECILTSDETSNTETTLTWYATADGGTNWEAITLNQRHGFTNTGTDLRFKCVFSTTDTTLLNPNINSYFDWFGYQYWYS